MSKMIRVSPETYSQIESIQSIIGSNKQEIVKKAIDKFNKELVLMEANKAFQKLKDDPKAWAEELAEREEWESFNDLVDNE